MHDNTEFPTRNEIKAKQPKNPLVMDYNYLSEQVKNLKLDEIDFDSADYDTIDKKEEKAKIYFWIRVYLSEELKDIEPGDDLNLSYWLNDDFGNRIIVETLVTKFICYSKTGLTRNEDGVVGYNGIDDPKCLCLMVDEEKINYDSEDILFIRKLFRIGRYYEYQLLRRTDLTLTINRTGERLNYYDIEF